MPSEEPDFIVQIEQDPQRHSEWFDERRREAEALGCTFGRYSVLSHADGRHAIIEGWKVRPFEQGRVRWKFAFGIPLHCLSGDFDMPQRNALGVDDQLHALAIAIGEDPASNA